MKKVITIVFFILLCMLFSNVNAEEQTTKNSNEEKKEVSLLKCTSSESFWVKDSSNKKYSVRLIAYDRKDGALNKEIDNYACELLTNAKKIEIKYDEASDKKDKYNRELVWVYVDDKLLQKELLIKGYGEVNYVTGNYDNLDNLCDSEAKAIKDKLGIWNYDDIKEDYCDSGIALTDNEDSKEKESNENKKYNENTLYYLLFLTSGIIILFVLYKVK